MNKREMANELMLRANRLRAQSGSPEFVAEAKLNVAASEALHREADAEEKAKPKVTLKEMISELENPYSVVPAPKSLKSTCYASTERERVCVAAADTLRRLDEEGGKLLHESLGIIMSSTGVRFRDLLRSLGVEPRS